VLLKIKDKEVIVVIVEGVGGWGIEFIVISYYNAEIPSVISTKET